MGSNRVSGPEVYLTNAGMYPFLDSGYSPPDYHPDGRNPLPFTQGKTVYKSGRFFNVSNRGKMEFVLVESYCC